MNGYKPTHSRLKGFTGIKRGLGKDEITVDLSNMNGLIAISGDNGRGKSTLLECLLPFPEFISKDSTHLADNVDTRNAEWELHFDYLENKYKILVKIDNHSRKIEGYIWKDEEPQVNGKISEYKRYIIKLLGSPKMAYNSIFCAQNSKKISELIESDVRGLFREFVGADKLEEMSIKSGDVKKHFKKELDRERAKLSTFDHIKEDIKKINGEEGTLETIETQRDIIKDNQFNLDCYIKENSCCFSHIQRQQQKAALSKVEKENIQNKISDLKEIQKQQQDERVNKIFELRMDIDNKKILSEEHEKTIEGKYNLISLKDDLSSEESILKERNIDFSALSELKKDSESRLELIQVDLSENHAEKEKLQNELNSLKDAYRSENKKLTDLKNNFKNQKYNTEIQSISGDINVLKAQIKPLETRHINCSESLSDCGFIKTAISAKDKLVKHEADLNVLENKKKTNDIILRTGIEVQASILDSIENEAAENSDEFKPVLKEYSLLKLTEWYEEKYKKTILFQFSNREKWIKESNKDINELKESIALIDESKITIAEHSLKLLKSNLADLEEQKVKINSLYDEKDLTTIKDIKILETELSKFGPENNYDQKLIDLADEKEQFQKDEKRIQKELQALEISLGTNRNKLEELNKNLQVSIEIEQKIKKLEKEVSHWEFIKIQTGKKGLQAIEIENAVPLIVENANNLLQQTYGNEFSLKILTKCEETGKEIFKIIAIYSDGTEDNFGDKSGGERVYLTKALSLGMALISKNKSGFVFDSAFADEEDSALDSENAACFIQLYRAFLKLGQFQNIFYISHRDESIEVADHEIKFSEKGIEVY